MASRGNQFLVFGRADGEDGFLTLSGVALTDELRALCTEVSEDEFRRDISSTQIRASQ